MHDGSLPDQTARETTAAADTPLVGLYRLMVRIREFEIRCRDIHAHRTGPGPTGEVTAVEQMPGFVHLYFGEEAVAVGVCSVLEPRDTIASTHRGHGHVIAKGGDVDQMMAELYGRASGYSRGKGGSMHIFAPELGVLGTNGIVAAGIPHALGAAVAHQHLGRDAVSVTFFGDGASNQGVFFECLNLAALWRLPVLFVCENNLYTEWTEVERLNAGSDLFRRAQAFDIPARQVDGNDVLAVRDAALSAVRRARAGGGPSFIEARTYYYGGHFEGEEVFSGAYRSDEDTSSWLARDPIPRLEGQLVSTGIASTSTLEGIRSEERDRIARAVESAVSGLPPDISELTTDVFAESVQAERAGAAAEFVT